MAHQFERLNEIAHRYHWHLGLALVVAVVLIVLSWGLSGSRKTEENSQSFVVSLRPFTSTISVSGIVVPEGSVEVVAPYEGTVSAIFFNSGDWVAQGQILLRVDTADLDQRVSRARRAVLTAEQAIATTRRKLAQSKVLLNEGLIPRDEYSDLGDQKRMQELALAAAREDLSAELKRGDELNHHPVTTAKSTGGVAPDANASSNNRTVVVAPVAGVLVQPGPEKVGSEGTQIRIGQKMARGQLIASIAQSDRLAILVRLSEVDLPRIHVGNSVYVVGPGFESTNLTGHVASLAGEARPSSDIDAHSTFMARIVLDRLTNTDAQRVRIGMSANVSIILYQTSSAIILPADAILGSPSNAMVKVRSADGVRTLPIRVGHSSSDGIEVVSGLKPGDIVVWDKIPGSPVSNLR